MDRRGKDSGGEWMGGDGEEGGMSEWVITVSRHSWPRYAFRVIQ